MQRPPEPTTVREERDGHVTRDAGQTIGEELKKNQRLVSGDGGDLLPPRAGLLSVQAVAPHPPTSGVGM